MTIDVASLCDDIPIDIDLDIDPLIVIFPGDVELSFQLPNVDIANPFDLAKQGLAMINTALMPLAPIFNIIDAVLALFEVIKAIPDALGPPPDPTKIIRAINKARIKLEKLLALVPVLSVPIMINGLLHVMIVFVTGLRDELNVMLKFQRSIDLGAERSALLASDPLTAFGAAQLDISLGCARATLAAQLQGLGQGAAPLNRMIKVVNLFLGLIGLDPLPEMGAIGVDLSGAVAPLDALINVLTTVRAAIVV